MFLHERITRLESRTHYGSILRRHRARSPSARQGVDIVECSLLYVSRSTIPRERLAAEIADINDTSREHNVRVGITGGLVRAGGYFAQLLEGPTEAVKTLMERIDRDRRHADVRVVLVVACDKRQLPDWSMASAGESTYVANQIAALLGPGLVANPERIARLNMLIVTFASM